MSKQLLIMRHAKSSWKEPGLSDFERPLNNRGRRVTPEVAKFIHDQGLVPDKIISSSAARARGTAELFIEHCDGIESSQLTLNDDFYHAPARIYLDALAAYDDESVNTLMFVGHNPGLEDLVEKLSDNWEIMPTAAVAHFHLTSEVWSEIDQTVYAELKNLWRPKEIGIH